MKIKEKRKKELFFSPSGLFSPKESLYSNCSGHIVMKSSSGGYESFNKNKNKFPVLTHWLEFFLAFWRFLIICSSGDN